MLQLHRLCYNSAVAFFNTRVKATEDDWSKLVRMKQYLHQSRIDAFTLKSNDSIALHWHVDAPFVVHPDFKSHTGGIITMGSGAIVSFNRK